MTIKNINEEVFKRLIFNYEKNKDWKYKDSIPSIVIFYEDKYEGCELMILILNELKEEYKNLINIYKVDTRVERNLKGLFEIESIPSCLFIPKEEQPQLAIGVLSKKTFKEAITAIFNI